MTTTAPMTDEELHRIIADLREELAAERTAKEEWKASCHHKQGLLDKIYGELGAEKQRNELASAIERDIIKRLTEELAAERAKVTELAAKLSKETT